MSNNQTEQAGERTQPCKEQWELMSDNVRAEYLAAGFSDPTRQSMNGAEVVARVKTGIYVRIPAELAAPINGGCRCTYCVAHPEQTPRWDTLLIPTKAPVNGRFDYVSHVHMPDPGTFRRVHAEMEAKAATKPYRAGVADGTRAKLVLPARPR